MGIRRKSFRAATIMSQYQKHIEELETDCGHGEEINGDELGEVVV
jgi:hypothetical protein